MSDKAPWITYRPELKVLDCTIRDGGLINAHIAPAGTTARRSSVNLTLHGPSCCAVVPDFDGTLTGRSRPVAAQRGLSQPTASIATRTD
jgi:hypothetical protein